MAKFDIEEYIANSDWTLEDMAYDSSLGMFQVIEADNKKYGSNQRSSLINEVSLCTGIDLQNYGYVKFGCPLNSVTGRLNFHYVNLVPVLCRSGGWFDGRNALFDIDIYLYIWKYKDLFIPDDRAKSGYMRLIKNYFEFIASVSDVEISKITTMDIDKIVGLFWILTQKGFELIGKDTSISNSFKSFIGNCLSSNNNTAVNVLELCERFIEKYGAESETSRYIQECISKKFGRGDQFGRYFSAYKYKIDHYALLKICNNSTPADLAYRLFKLIIESVSIECEIEIPFKIIVRVLLDPVFCGLVLKDKILTNKIHVFDSGKKSQVPIKFSFLAEYNSILHSSIQKEISVVYNSFQELVQMALDNKSIILRDLYFTQSLGSTKPDSVSNFLFEYEESTLSQIEMLVINNDLIKTCLKNHFNKVYYSTWFAKSLNKWLSQQFESEFDKIFFFEQALHDYKLEYEKGKKKLDKPKGWFEFGKYMEMYLDDSHTIQWLLMLFRQDKISPSLTQWIEFRITHKNTLPKVFPQAWSPWAPKDQQRGLCAAGLFKILKEARTPLGKLLLKNDTLLKAIKANQIMYGHYKEVEHACYILKFFNNDAKAALHLVTQHGTWAKAHKIIGNIKLDFPNWNVWQPLVMKLTGSDRALTRHLRDFEKYLNSHKNCKYSRNFGDLRKWCIEHKLGLSLDKLDAFSTLDKSTVNYAVSKGWGKPMLNKVFSFVPKSSNLISMKEFTTTKARVRLLEPGDKLALYIGQVTGCCQHISGHATKCAIQSYTDKNTSVVVIESLDGSKVYAQSFLWISDDEKIVVMDSIESLYSGSNQQYMEIVVEAINQFVSVLSNNYKIVISNTAYGMTSYIVNAFRHKMHGAKLELFKYEQHIQSKSELGYTDFCQERGFQVKAMA